MSDNNPTPKPITNTPIWQRAAKAVYGALISGAIAFVSAILPFVSDGKPMSAVGWLTAILATLVALAATGGVVYQVSNHD